MIIKKKVVKIKRPKGRKITLKKILKVLGGLVVFITLPTLLLYLFLYLKYDEHLPVGKTGPEADVLAENMLDALNHEAYQNTAKIDWNFDGRRHYKWDRTKNRCTVNWKNFKVELYFDDLSQSLAYVHNFRVYNERSQELVDEAVKYFNNDSFWVVAPYKVFDEGVIRSIVKTDEGTDGLLVTFTSGGSTPGDSYLWILDKNYKPKAFKMWTSILPIDGLEASWEQWKVTESGAVLPTLHKLLLFGIDIRDLKTERKE